MLKNVYLRFKKLFKLWRAYPSLVLEPGVTIKGDLENIDIKGHVVIQGGTTIHLGGMDWCQDDGFLSIDDGSVISHNCVLFACGPDGITIGKNVDCGPNVGIFSSRTDYTKGPENHIFEPVVIGDDVIIYANSVISPGVTIHDRAAIAAGSVVIEDVEANTLVGGVPAKILKKGIRTDR